MKTSSLWSGIIGAIVIIIAAAGIIGRIGGHIELPFVTGVEIFQGLLAIALGGYLVYFYLRGKSNADKGQTIAEAADNPEDLEHLHKKRRIIFAFILFSSAAASADIWLLNNYFVGLTPNNVFVIFDLLSNLLIVVTSFRLIFGAEKLVKPLFYFLVIYSVVEAVLYVWRGHGFSALSCILTLVYFAYSVGLPVSRKTFRMANLVILPLVILSFFVTSALDGINLNNIAREEGLAEQQYAGSLDVVSTKYTLFLQHEVPTLNDISDVQDSLSKLDTDAATLNDVLAKEKAIYSNQIASTGQQRSLEHLRKFDVLLEAQRVQAEKVAEFMLYAKTLNFNNLTASQSEKISDFKSSVDTLGKAITDAQYQLNNEVR